MSLYIDLVARSGEQLIEAIRMAQDRTVKVSASLADALRWPALPPRESAIAMEICFDFAEQLLESQRGYVQRVRETIHTGGPHEDASVDVLEADTYEEEGPVAPLIALNGRSHRFVSAHQS